MKEAIIEILKLLSIPLLVIFLYITIVIMFYYQEKKHGSYVKPYSIELDEKGRPIHQDGDRKRVWDGANWREAE